MAFGFLVCGTGVFANNRQIEIEEQQKLDWVKAQERAKEREAEQIRIEKAKAEEEKKKAEEEAKKKAEEEKKKAEAEAKKKAEKEEAEKIAKAEAEAEAEAEARRQAELLAQQKAEEELIKKQAEANYEPPKTTYNGEKLTPAKGRINGPSGQETYYNLDMSGVVNIMRGMGNNDQYWVREDGVKMLGDYVMVAASFNIRPRGSLVETSLGMGIVCDTGGFAHANPTQIDIAVTW